MLSKRYLISVVAKRFIYRRTPTNLTDRALLSNDILWKTIEKSSIKSPQDWRDVRNEILNTNGLHGKITPTTIDAMTVGICTSKKAYDLALSYLDFLQEEEIKPNLATLGKYFKLLYIKSADTELSQEDEERILMLYDNLRRSYPVLDPFTLESVIQAVSLTSKWPHCVDLLEEIKIAATPSALSYNTMISAAFSNNADHLGWKLLSEMLATDRSVQGTVYSSYFKKVAKNSKQSEILKEIEKMFDFLRANSLKIDSDSVEDLLDALKKIRLRVHPSVVTNRGVCKSCKSQLINFDLTETEFDDLKNKIFQNVIVGKDVFNKTTPDEVTRFKDFITQMDKFDVVIDGLNVAYSAGVQQSQLVTSGLVASVVSHFVDQDKKVLVLGRNHMNKWPPQNWGYVTQKATVFLTQNLSQDDPYLLYCALNSGKDTIIVTKDLMRGHKFLLRNPHLKVLFDRWLSQRQHQLVYVPDSGKPIFKMPPPFSNVAQKGGGYWHVPYTLKSQDKASAAHAWLCIQC